MNRWQIVLAITSLFTVIEGDKIFRFASCNCDFNEEYINITKCELKALSREKVVTNVDVFILKDVFNGSLHLSLLKMSSSGQFYPFLVDYMGNGCELVKGTSTNFFLKQTVRIMRKFSNIAQCQHKVISFFFYFLFLTLLFLGWFLLL